MSELQRQKEEVKLKMNDLQKLDDSNAHIKKQNYDREIEQLNRKFQNIEKQRTEMQTKLENAHYEWSCKLQIYVTDISTQRAQTENDIK